MRLPAADGADTAGGCGGPRLFVLRGNSDLYTSGDGGETFNLTQAGNDALALYQIECHPFVPSALLGLAKSLDCFDKVDQCHSSLHVSFDFGGTWRLLRGYVNKATWSLATSVDDMTIMYNFFEDETGNSFSRSPSELRFAVSDDLLQTSRVWFNNAPDFIATNVPEDDSSFIWVGVVQQNNALLLHASTDRGQSFKLVR